MNNATLAVLSNFPLLPICYYISAFSTFFISKDLMTINDENQSVPVINALFEYLNKSKNESLAKNQLLLEVITKSNFYPKYWNTFQDMKDVNETYQYIITASLFHHCKDITEYLSEHANRKESTTFPEFRNIVQEALLDKCINNNPCSAINGSTKLTPLAIEELLKYISPVYNQERISNVISNNLNSVKLTKLKRFKRQPPISIDNFYVTDNEIERGIESKINESDVNFYFTNEQRQELLSYLEGQSTVNDFLRDTSVENIDRSQHDAVKKPSNTMGNLKIFKIGNKPLNSGEYSQSLTYADNLYVSDNEIEREIESKINTEPDSNFYFTNEEGQELLAFLQGQSVNDSLHSTSVENTDRSQHDAVKKPPNAMGNLEIVKIGNKQLNSGEYSQPLIYADNLYVTDNEIERGIKSKINESDDNFYFTNEQRQELLSFLQGQSVNDSLHGTSVEDIDRSQHDAVKEPPNAMGNLEIVKIGNNQLNSGENSQPLIYADNLYVTDNEIERGIKSKINESDANFYFTNEQRQELLAFLQGQSVNDSLQGTSVENTDESQQNAVKIPPNLMRNSQIVKIGNKSLNSEENLHVTKIRLTDSESRSSTNNTDFIDNDFDLNKISKKCRNKRTLIMLEYINSEQKNPKSFKNGDNGKSERMLSIEKAAKIIRSCEPKRNFTYTVNMLKGFLLKSEESTTTVPTYEELAIDFCVYLEVPSSYNSWKIPNHKYINEVLFNSYLDDIGVSKLGKFKSWGFLKQYPIELLKTDLKMYQDSMKLRKSLRIQEFLMLRLQLLHSTTQQPYKRSETLTQMTAAFYRLALRECEEDWIDEKITLYALDFDKHLKDLRTNSSARRDYTFNKYVEFSADLSKEISKLDELNANTIHLVLFTIELENQAGTVNIDRLLENNTSGRYIVPINMSFAIRQAEPIIINKFKIFSIKMHDERLKEKKMIDMVEKLYNILNYFPENLLSNYS